MRSFMQSLDEKIYKKLDREAEKKGLKVQELIRIIVAGWLKEAD